MMSDIKCEYGKDFPRTQCNTCVEHPYKTIRKKRADTALIDPRIRSVLHSGDGQSVDPIDDGLMAGWILYSKVIFEDSKNSKNCSKTDSSNKEKLHSNIDKTFFVTHGWSHVLLL
jgi:hypothetical protein